MLAETSVGTTSSNRPRFFINGQLLCDSPRVPVVATVTTPPTLTISSNTQTICVGDTTSVVTITAGANDYETFVWTPSTGVSGNAVSGWTFNPTTTTNYTLTASQAPQNIVSNGDFSNGLTGWTSFVASWIPVNATFTATNNEANITGISGAGGQPWFVQLNQILTPAQIASLEVGSSYKITFSARSSVNNRSLKIFFGQDGGAFVPLHEQVYSISNTNANYETTVFNVGQTFGTMKLGFEMGLMNDDVFIDNVTLTKVVSNICNTSTSFNVTVNPVPSALVITPSATETCIDNVVTLSTSGGTLSNVVILQENFNDQTNSWTTLNNSTGGTPANVAWTLRPNGYVRGITFNSNDNTQFYLSDSDDGGSGNITNASLITPSFSTIGFTQVNLNFWHFYQHWSSGNGQGNVQYSLDGGVTWANINQFTSSQGTSTGFVNANLALPAGALNQATVQIRFQHSVVWGYRWAIDNVSITGTQSQSVTWTPITNLYTNAAATIPYTANTTSATVYYKPTVDGTAQFTATSTTLQGCFTTQNVSIITNPTPAAPIANATQIFCGASTVSNLVATGSALQWYNVATGGTALATNASISTGTYFVTQTLLGCESPRTSVQVTVNITNAPIATNQVFCNSATVSNLVANGTALQWYDVAIGGTALTSGTALVTGTYYVSQTLNNCEGPRTMVEVVVNIPSAPSGDASQTFCGTANLSQLSISGLNIRIYTAATGGTEYPQALWNLIGLVNGSSYFASQTINGCESLSRLQITVAINPIPSAPTATNQSFCGSLNATVSNLNASGSNLKWYNVPTGGIALAPNTLLVSGTYYVTQTSANCESNRTTVLVTVNDCNIGWGNLQWPPSGTINSCGDYTVYGRVWKSGVTEATGPSANITAWFGINTTNTDPSTWPASAWSVGTYNVQAGNDDEYQHTFSNLPIGTYYIATRYQFTGGDFWYGGYNSGGGGAWNGTTNVSSVLTVAPVAAPVGDAVQSVTVPLAPNATLANLVVSGTNVTWYPTLADAQAGTNALPLSTVLVSGNTYYAVSIVNGCRSAALAVTVTVNLDIRVFDFAQLRVYPNPVIERLTITFDYQLERIEVYNMLGQMVRFQQPNFTETEVDMINLPAATYIVRIYSNDSVKEVKVIKK